MADPRVLGLELDGGRVYITKGGMTRNETITAIVMTPEYRAELSVLTKRYRVAQMNEADGLPDSVTPMAVADHMAAAIERMLEATQ